MQDQAERLRLPVAYKGGEMMEKKEYVTRTDILETALDIVGEVMGWTDEESDAVKADALEYLFGMYDTAKMLLRRLKDD